MINSVRNKYSEFLIGNGNSQPGKAASKKAKSDAAQSKAEGEAKPMNSSGSPGNLKSLAPQGILKELTGKVAAKTPKEGAQTAPSSGAAASTAQANVGSF